MSWVTQLFEAAKLAVDKPERDNASKFVERMDSALKIAALYKANPALVATDKKNLSAIIRSLHTVLGYYIAQFPVTSVDKYRFGSISAFADHKIFSRQQKTELQGKIDNVMQTLFRDYPEKAHENFLGNYIRLDRGTTLTKQVVDLTVQNIDRFGKKNPTLAVNSAIKAFWYTKEESSQGEKLLSAIEKYAPGYAERYVGVGEDVPNPLMAFLLYTEDKKARVVAEKAWHHYTKMLTQQVKTQPARGPDPPGILTLPREADDFRLQVFSAIHDLAVVAINDGKRLHALAVARESFQNHFDFLAEINPVGAAKFGMAIINDIWWAAREESRKPELGREVRGFMDDIMGKFLSTNLAEQCQVIEADFNNHNLALFVAGHAYDPERRCFALETAVRNFEKAAVDGKFVSAATGMLEIVKLAVGKGDEHEPLSGEDTPAQAKRKSAAKRTALQEALACARKFPPSAYGQGADVCISIAGYAHRGSGLQKDALQEAKAFCEKLARNKPLDAIAKLECLAKLSAELKIPANTVDSVIADIRAPRPLLPNELAALQRFKPGAIQP